MAEDAGAKQCSRLFAGETEPEGSIGGVPVGRGLRREHVGQRAPVLEATEGQEQLEHILLEPRRQEAACGDQRIPAPVQEPGVAGDDGLALIPVHQEGRARLAQLAPEGVLCVKGRVLGQGQDFGILGIGTGDQHR